MDEEPHWATNTKGDKLNRALSPGVSLEQGVKRARFDSAGIIGLDQFAGRRVVHLPVALCTMIRGQFRLTVATRE